MSRRAMSGAPGKRPPLNLPCPASGLFFFNDPATTEIYTLALRDALPISAVVTSARTGVPNGTRSPQTRYTVAKPDIPETRHTTAFTTAAPPVPDRKSTRLNSSHANISYAVFCLKKNDEQARDERGPR